MASYQNDNQIGVRLQNQGGIMLHKNFQTWINMPYAKAIIGWKGINRLDKMNSGSKVMLFLSSFTQHDNATAH